MTYDLVCKKSQFINSSKIHKFFATTAANNANSLHAFWDGAPEPLKFTSKRCSISWSSVSISSFVYNKLPLTQPPCCVIFNGSGTQSKKYGDYLHCLQLSWPKFCERWKN